MKIKYKILILQILFACISTTALAQVYDEPLKVKWNQLKTPHFKIVYPRGIDSIAQNYANALEKAYCSVSRSLSHYYKGAIPLVLHCNDLNSNAWVSFAPRQMDFITAPITDLHITPWAKSLVLHEFRHYVQISKYNTRGILKYASYLFGDFTSVAWAGMVPDWFFEGDATLSETAMSLSGRGRMPRFFAEYRAYFLSDKNFSYDKWLHGSYKNFIPNSYAYGYIQTSYARSMFGEDVWAKTLEQTQTTSFPFFGRGFKATTKISLKQLQRESFDYLKNTWETENRTQEQNINYITGNEKKYIKYLYPYFADNENIIAVKHSLHKMPALVAIDKNGIEECITDLGYYSDKIYLNNNKIYWIETINDIRWTAKSSNTVRFYDLKISQIQTAATKTRYRKLAFSDSTELCAAAESTRDGKNFICILNKDSFKQIAKIQTPQNAVITSMAMNVQGDAIAASLLADEGMSLQILDLKNNEWKILIPSSFVNIANISFYGKDIIFDSGFDGVDNLYLVSAETKKIFRLTHSRFGAIAVNNKNGNIAYSEYYDNGLKIATKKIQFDENNAIDWRKPYKFELAEIVAAQENFVIDTIKIDDSQYETKRYGKLENLFRVRNWLPFYAGINPEEIIISGYDADNENQKLRLGATVLSQNLLGNATTQLSYSHSNNYSALHAGFTYSGWFPIVTIEGHYGGGKNLLVQEDATAVQGNQNRFNIEATVHIPLNFSNARYAKGITPVVKFSVNNSKYFVPSSSTFKNANMAEYGITAYSYKRLSTKDIFPAWGLIANFHLRHSPFDTENFGNIWGTKMIVYIPGLLANHGLRMSAAYQKQNFTRYIYSTIYDFPRETTNLFGQNTTMFTFDYSLPVAYPDLNIGALTYITRIRTNLFYDFATNKNIRTDKNNNIYSFGADFLFDAYWFRLPNPLSIGFRLYKTYPENKFGAGLIGGIVF